MNQKSDLERGNINPVLGVNGSYFFDCYLIDPRRPQCIGVLRLKTERVLECRVECNCEKNRGTVAMLARTLAESDGPNGRSRVANMLLRPS